MPILQNNHGPILVQRAVPVLEGDTPDTLAARVFEAECQAYPEAIRLFSKLTDHLGTTTRSQRSPSG